MIAKKVLSDDKVDIQVLVLAESTAPNIVVQHMLKVGDEWKLGGSAGLNDDWYRDGQIQWLTPTP
jgi:hypothetical protein